MTGDHDPEQDGFVVANTLLRSDGSDFLASPEALQTEAFGNVIQVVVAEDVSQITAIIDTLEGSLTSRQSASQRLCGVLRCSLAMTEFALIDFRKS